jgi:hypothetical protein
MVSSALQEGGALKTTNRGTPNILARTSALARGGGGVQEFVGEIAGPSAQGLARAVANVPGPGQKPALDALSGRRDGMSSRMLKAVSRATGNPQSYGDVVFDLKTTGKKAAAASYDKSMNAADQVTVPRLDNLTGELDDYLYSMPQGPGLIPTDAQLSGLQRARAGVKQLEQLASSGRLSLRGVERIRQQLNTILRGAKNDAYDAFAVREVMGFVDKKLDAIAMQSPEIATALTGLKASRQGYGTQRQTEEAIEQGLKALREDATDAKLWMYNDGRGRKPAERDGYTIGVVRAVTDMVNRSDTAGIARINRDKNIQEVFAQVLGADKTKKLLARVNREVAMQGSNNAITAGSRTTPLREEVDRWTTGEDELSFLADLIQNPSPIRSTVLKGFAQMYDRIRRPGLYNPRISAAVSEILYARATPQRVRQLLADIERDPVAQQALRAAIREQTMAQQAPAVGFASGSVAGQMTGQ